MFRIELERCRLYEVLQEKSLSVQDLIDRTGYSKQEISNWATGIKQMSLKTAFTVSLAVGCQPMELYKTRKIFL